MCDMFGVCLALLSACVVWHAFDDRGVVCPLTRTSRCVHTQGHQIAPRHRSRRSRATAAMVDSMNWNAKVVLMISPLFMVSVSLTGTPIAAFVLLLTKKNWEVGLASGVSGIATLIVGPFAGWGADRLGRQGVLRFASVFTFVASGFLCTWLLYFQQRVSEWTLYEMLLASQFLTGVRRGIQQPALDAIFGDSVPSGRRSKVYAFRSSLRRLGSAVGPIVAACIFAVAGDHWTEFELTHVLVVGAIFRLIPASLLWFIRDARALGDESEGLHIRPPNGAATAAATAAITTTASVNAATCPLPAAVDAAPAAAAPSPPDPGPTPSNPAPPAQSRRLGPQHIAPMIAVADIIAKVGAGLSVRFLPLYMWQHLSLRPLPVCLVLAAAELGGAAWVIIAQRLSVWIGRIQTILLVKSSAICCLVAIALLPEPYQLAASIVPLYLLRTWLMNSPLALSKSVLNDYIPKKHRAKWASLEAVNTSTWAGSAVLGGFIADCAAAAPPPSNASSAFGASIEAADSPPAHYCYRRVFLITAALQALGLAFYVPLIALVAAEAPAPRAAKRHPPPRAISSGDAVADEEGVTHQQQAHVHEQPAATSPPWTGPVASSSESAEEATRGGRGGLAQPLLARAAAQ